MRFEYQGLHNDLRRLLGQQTLRQSVSVTFFTTAQRPMLLNCLYSMIKYGKAFNYIVVTIDHGSLAECLRLRLPCYNATHLLGDFASGTDYSFGSPQYRKLVHSKPAIVWEVLRLGVNVHFTDVDVSFLRRVWPTFNRFLQLTGADMAFMNEYTHLNTGNFVIKYNERTVQAVRAWATAAPERDKYVMVICVVFLDDKLPLLYFINHMGACHHPHISSPAYHKPSSHTSKSFYSYLTDQEWLISLNDKHYKHCNNKRTCRQLQRAGIAALALHPSQFGKVSWTGHCPGRRPWHVCAPSMLYLHVICYSGQEHKTYWMKHYNLWHLKEDDFTPVGNATKHAYLPCADDVAWREPPPGARADADLVYPKTVFDDQDDEDVKNLPRPAS